MCVCVCVCMCQSVCLYLCARVYLCVPLRAPIALSIDWLAFFFFFSFFLFCHTHTLFSPSSCISSCASFVVVVVVVVVAAQALDPKTGQAIPGAASVSWLSATSKSQKMTYLVYYQKASTIPPPVMYTKCGLQAGALLLLNPIVTTGSTLFFY